VAVVVQSRLPWEELVPVVAERLQWNGDGCSRSRSVAVAEVGELTYNSREMFVIVNS
jgi:hypothetical protein